MTGIIPKMAIRFTSYEWYKQILAKDGKTTPAGTFVGKSIDDFTKHSHRANGKELYYRLINPTIFIDTLVAGDQLSVFENIF